MSEIVIPGEDNCCTFLSLLMSEHQGLPTSNVYQKQVQQLLDLSFSHLVQDKISSIWDKACLNTLSIPHSGSWLRALPNNNLGLVMSWEEFLIVLRLCLGIAVFPSSPSLVWCLCGQIIDKFGDHILGCSSGQLRSKRHSAMCDVLYQNLLVDNAGACREQRCSSESSDRPGGVFHPDFLQGKAYFDISVRNSFSSQFLISCAADAGSAAVAGEIQKVLCYDLEVTVAGGIFYPMIVETFGTWTSYSLEIIKIIARRTSLLNITVEQTHC